MQHALLLFLAPSAYDCNFECNCTCNWVNDLSTNFTWRVTRGATASVNTGPDTDHTTGTRLGYYIYIETSLPAKFNDTARLISPDLIVADQESCFRFYYHMFGSDIYRLNVYAKISKFEGEERKSFDRVSLSFSLDGSLGKALWQKEGNQVSRRSRRMRSFQTHLPSG